MDDRAQTAYETIFAPYFTQWPPRWDALSLNDQQVFERIVRVDGAATGKLEPGIYRGRAVSWTADLATTQEGQRAILRVRFSVSGRGTVDWTCWLEQLFDKEGRPSPNLRGLLALGITEDDIRGYLAGAALQGLDRNEVEIDVQRDDKNYLKVKWVNGGPRDLRAKTPLDVASQTRVAQQLLGALTQLRGKGALPPQAQRPPEPAKACVDHNSTTCTICPRF